MKKTIVMFMVIVILFTPVFYGCGDKKTIKGKTYGTYGLFNKDDMRNPDVEYKIIIGNVVWSVILVETIIAPIYFIGFSIYEPVGEKASYEPGVVTE